MDSPGFCSVLLFIFVGLVFSIAPVCICIIFRRSGPCPFLLLFALFNNLQIRVSSNPILRDSFEKKKEYDRSNPINKKKKATLIH